LIIILLRVNTCIVTFFSISSYMLFSTQQTNQSHLRLNRRTTIKIQMLKC